MSANTITLSEAAALASAIEYAIRWAGGSFIYYASTAPGTPTRRISIHHSQREEIARVATVLLRENHKSIRARYPKSHGLDGEPDTVTVRDIPSLAHHTPAQVIQSCRYYEYQSCEHAGYRDSEAAAIIAALTEAAVSAIPAVQSAKWGIPVNVC